MTVLTVVGLDPSFRNFGMSKGKLDLNAGTLSLSEVELSQSSTGKELKSVRQNSKDLNAAKTQFTGMTEFIKGSDLIFVEVPHGSQSARASASYGICIGILASIEIPLIQVTANEVKIASTGNKTETKRGMINWAYNLYPDIDWFTQKRKGISVLTDKNEHIADSIAAIHAGVKTDEFKRLLTVLK